MSLRRILALDLGTRRIGLAVSDPLGITAQGLPTLARQNLHADLEALARVALDHDVVQIVLGDPLRMNGEPGRQSEWVRGFAARLEKRLRIPVAFCDERLTSREAERALRGSGVANADRKGTIDRMSAVLLLQSYLDAALPLTLEHRD